MQAIIEAKLKPLKASYLQVINESHLHAGPASNSHFKLIICSDVFMGLNKVARHQQIYALLKEELEQELHALSMYLYSPDEWQQTQQVPASPKCQGAHKG